MRNHDMVLRYCGRCMKGPRIGCFGGWCGLPTCSVCVTGATHQPRAIDGRYARKERAANA